MLFAMGDDLSCGLINTLGMLCLWQCFISLMHNGGSCSRTSLSLNPMRLSHNLVWQLPAWKIDPGFPGDPSAKGRWPSLSRPHCPVCGLQVLNKILYDPGKFYYYFHNSYPCENFQWSTGPWGQCTLNQATCGTGVGAVEIWNGIGFSMMLRN